MIDRHMKLVWVQRWNGRAGWLTDEPSHEIAERGSQHPATASITASTATRTTISIAATAFSTTTSICTVMNNAITIITGTVWW